MGYLYWNILHADIWSLCDGALERLSHAGTAAGVRTESRYSRRHVGQFLELPISGVANSDGVDDDAGVFDFVQRVTNVRVLILLPITEEGHKSTL